MAILSTAAGRLAAAAAVAALMAAAPGAAAQPPQFDESQVKAAFLFNFMKFVEWPSPDPRSRPLVICVAGPDDVRNALAAIVKQAPATAGLAVRPLTDGDDPRACHSVFIAASEARRTAEVVERVAGAAVLTVGETSSFLNEGGLIRFYVSENRLRFQIDPVGARVAGLRVSAQLLSLGR
ncbi:MAG: YfiR family protein [Acidobacteria bacterium]|nr:YfiR family protein [Acidobacteriota bacterium]